MKRVLFWPCSTILLLGVLVLPACGQQDSAESVLADCSGHIPREKVDSCLERARVFDETNPSSDLQALEADLQKRAMHHEEAHGAPPPGYDPNQGPPPGYTPDQGSPSGYDQDQPPPADQPPQGDDPNQQPPQGFDNSPPPPPPPSSDETPPPEGPRGDVSPPVDRTGPGDLVPPDEGPQGPPPDNTPPPDDSETQGPGQ